jgi:hypothetical protein
MVIKKMINITSITSTRGVVLMADMTASSSPSGLPTFMDIELTFCALTARD